VDYHFVTENHFLTIHSYSVLEEASTRNKEGTHNFLKGPSLNSGALAVHRQPKNPVTATAPEIHETSELLKLTKAIYFLSVMRH